MDKKVMWNGYGDSTWNYQHDISQILSISKRNVVQKWFWLMSQISIPIWRMPTIETKVTNNMNVITHDVIYRQNSVLLRIFYPS